MRQYIRHPSDIPIEVCCVNDGEGYSRQAAQNVSYGGLAIYCDHALAPDTRISMRITCLQPAFEMQSAKVAWCRRVNHNYIVGIEFPNADDAFRMRMVEQICHIESYRRDVCEKEGRELSAEAAAEEWISRYASSFPNP